MSGGSFDRSYVIRRWFNSLFQAKHSGEKVASGTAETRASSESAD